jgi:hypothetical protein
MSQTKQQAGAAGTPKPRKDWELFWRIIAGLMVLVIAWVLWVLYQITPRSVVTPLAYATPIRSIGMHQAATGAAAPTSPQSAIASAAPPPAAVTTEADEAMDRAQAAARAGAHQASADVRASSPEQTGQPIQGVGLRLATEISTPAADKPSAVKPPGGRSGGAPAPDAAGNQRP